MKNEKGREMNNSRRRREAKEAAKYANPSYVSKADTMARYEEVQANNQRIADGVAASKERRAAGISRPPRAIRRRPLQEAYRKAQSK
jgi:hypothetical protein